MRDSIDKDLEKAVKVAHSGILEPAGESTLNMQERNE